jgi:hypothetical protein
VIVPRTRTALWACASGTASASATIPHARIHCFDVTSDPFEKSRDGRPTEAPTPSACRSFPVEIVRSHLRFGGAAPRRLRSAIRFIDIQML